MKIAFLSRYQNRVKRGAETFVNELSSRLANKHQVEVLAGEDADSLQKVLAGKFDIVIPINGRLQSLKVALARLIGDYKLLISGHSGIGRDDIWNIVVARPDVFVALTDYMANWAKKWAWGIRIEKISNGIDLNRFSPEGEKIRLDLPKPVILSIGALVWYKHHDRVIQAVARLGQGSLLIVGQGPEKDKLKKLGQQLLGDRFRIANFEYEDIPKVYRSCDIFSLPSWDREAFGIVYLEALSSGLGVVAPDDQSRHEIIGDAGIFVGVDDPLNYAVALKKAMVFDWSKKARTQAEKFSWEKIASDYEKVMLSLEKRSQR